MKPIPVLTSIVTIYAILTKVWWIDYVAYYHLVVLLMAIGAWGWQENIKSERNK